MNVQQSKIPYIMFLAVCLFFAAADNLKKDHTSNEVVTIQVESTMDHLQSTNEFFMTQLVEEE